MDNNTNNVNNKLNNNIVPQPQDLNNNLYGGEPAVATEQVQPNIVVPPMENTLLQTDNATQNNVVVSTQPDVIMPQTSPQVFVEPQPVDVMVNSSAVVTSIDDNGLENSVLAYEPPTVSSEYDNQLIEAPGVDGAFQPVIEAPGINPEANNVVAQQPVQVPKEKKLMNKKNMFLWLIVIVLVAVGIAIFLFLNKDDNNKTPEQPKEPVVKEPDWDPSTSKIKISPSATKLECSMEEEFNGMKNKVVYIHVYEEDVYTQVVIEDEIIFNEDTIQYYDYYVGSAKEEVAYETEAYDNIIIEVREKKSSVILAYSFDLTASTDNPKNMLDDKELSQEDMKLKMENLGFTCK